MELSGSSVTICAIHAMQLYASDAPWLGAAEDFVIMRDARPMISTCCSNRGARGKEGAVKGSKRRALLLLRRTQVEGTSLIQVLKACVAPPPQHSATALCSVCNVRPVRAHEVL